MSAWIEISLARFCSSAALRRTLYDAWTMMEQPSPGHTIAERHFIRIKDSISGGTDILCDLEGGRRFSTLPVWDELILYVLPWMP